VHTVLLQPLASGIGHEQLSSTLPLGNFADRSDCCCFQQQTLQIVNQQLDLHPLSCAHTSTQEMHWQVTTVAVQRPAVGPDDENTDRNCTK